MEYNNMYGQLVMLNEYMSAGNDLNSAEGQRVRLFKSASVEIAPISLIKKLGTSVSIVGWLDLREEMFRYFRLAGFSEILRNPTLIRDFDKELYRLVY